MKLSLEGLTAEQLLLIAQALNGAKPSAEIKPDKPDKPQKRPKAPVKKSPEPESSEGPGISEAPGPVDTSEAPQSTGKDDSSVTIEMVRSELVQKVQAHRPEIVKKLREFGAKNVSTLDAEYYSEFLAYLQSL